MHIKDLMLNNPHLQFNHYDEKNMYELFIFFQKNSAALIQKDGTYKIAMNYECNLNTPDYTYNDFINEFLPDHCYIREDLSKALLYVYSNLILAIRELNNIPNREFTDKIKSGINIVIEVETQSIVEIKIPMMLFFKQDENIVILNIDTTIDKNYEVSFNITKNNVVFKDLQKIPLQFLNIICIEGIEKMDIDLYSDYSFEDVNRFKTVLTIYEY